MKFETEEGGSGRGTEDKVRVVGVFLIWRFAVKFHSIIVPKKLSRGNLSGNLHNRVNPLGKGTERVSTAEPKSLTNLYYLSLEIR